MKKRQAIEEVLQNAEHVKPAPPPGVILLKASDVKVTPVRWLWKHWIARGKFHLLAGAPGQGKTTIAIGLAAAVSRGGTFPDGTSCKPGNVVIYSGEDDPADTLVPRLMAAGADLNRCRFVSATVDGDGSRPFDPAKDMDALSAAIDDLGDIALLIADPVVGIVTGDSNKNTETRRALQPLADLAADADCAVLGITHFTKGGQGSDPAMRVTGSVAFTALARVVIVAAKVAGEGTAPKRVMARAKSNIGPDDGGFEYHLGQTEVATGVWASRCAWGDAVEGTARDLLAEPEYASAEQASAKDAAEQFLLEALAEGITPAKTIRAEATEAGYAWRTVRRAADALGVKRTKGGMGDGWYWRLPEGVQKTAKVSNLNDGHLREDLDTFDGLPANEPTCEATTTAATA